jgi:hypothetical protein
VASVVAMALACASAGAPAGVAPCGGDAGRWVLRDTALGETLGRLEVDGRRAFFVASDGCPCEARRSRVRSGRRPRLRARWRAGQCPGLLSLGARLKVRIATDTCQVKGRLTLGADRAVRVRGGCDDAGAAIPGTTRAVTNVAGPTTTPVCPGGVVGDLALLPRLCLPHPPPGAGSVGGTVANVDGRRHRIVGWAHTDRRYVQPSLDDPFTDVCSDGSWSFATHGGSRHVVLVVDESYRVPDEPGIDHHPSIDPGVVAWAEAPPTKTVVLGGGVWFAKDSNGSPTGPDGNVFSEHNVSIDERGDLRLHLARREGRLTAAEVHHSARLGPGVYTFAIRGRLDDVGPREVRALFLFAAPGRSEPWQELDLECSRALTACEGCCQFVVQPWERPGNRRVFPVPVVDGATLRIEWRLDAVRFTLWRGFDPHPPPETSVIHDWTYAGPDVPQGARLLARANVWLVGGTEGNENAAGALVLGALAFAPLDGGGLGRAPSEPRARSIPAP